ncbi:hypothetical protein NW763_010433 [Fusarium oxysporum]|nr:hypothetical protein NW763_010433 [Fusarium oxysporum]
MKLKVSADCQAGFAQIRMLTTVEVAGVWRRESSIELPTHHPMQDWLPSGPSSNEDEGLPSSKRRKSISSASHDFVLTGINFGNHARLHQGNINIATVENVVLEQRELKPQIPRSRLGVLIMTDARNV